METVRLDFDHARMKRQQIIALILNAVISTGLFVLLLLGRIYGIALINAFYEIILFIVAFEMTLTIFGALRFIGSVRNTVRTVVLSEESITINDDTFLNSTDYDVRYIIAFGFLNLDISLFNVYSSLLRVKDCGNNTTKTYWMGPVGDKDCKEKRALFKKTLLQICKRDLSISVMRDIEKNTVGDTTTIEFPHKKTIGSMLGTGLVLLAGGVVNLIIAVTIASDLIRMLQLCIAMVFIVMGILVLIGFLSNMTGIVKKITVDPQQLRVDDDIYPWGQEPQIKISFDPKGAPRAPAGNELANRSIYLFVTSPERTKRYYLGTTSTPGCKRCRALLIEALRRNDPKARKDTEE